MEPEGEKPEHIIPERGYGPRMERHRLVLDNLDFTDVKTALDVGCGLGEFLEAVAVEEQGVLLCGLDSDITCLSEARGHARALYVLADCGRLPFRDGCFDLITAVDVIEHLENPTAFMRECLRVSSKKAVFATPNLGRPSRVWKAMLGQQVREVSGHRQGWDIHLFRQMLEVAGWRVQKIMTRFVDAPFYGLLPKAVSRYLSYNLLMKLAPNIGSELYAFCVKDG
jgi:2-polyprenyl-3-methyl-5-hydroxy-6-metoxy-1,4-benzoquinol methylase